MGPLLSSVTSLNVVAPKIQTRGGDRHRNVFANCGDEVVGAVAVDVAQRNDNGLVGATGRRHGKCIDGGWNVDRLSHLRRKAQPYGPAGSGRGVVCGSTKCGFTRCSR